MQFRNEWLGCYRLDQGRSSNTNQ